VGLTLNYKAIKKSAPNQDRQIPTVVVKQKTGATI